MKRALFLVAVILVSALRARAESADLKIYQFEPGAVVRAGDTFFGNIHIVNAGPDTARNVVVTQEVSGWPEAQLPCPQGRCLVGDVQPFGFLLAPRIEQALPVRDFTFTMTVTVSSDTPDPNPGNNSVTRTVRVSTEPLLRVWPRVPDLVDPGAAFDAAVSITNESPEYAVAHDIVMSLDVPDGVRVTAMPESCVLSGQQVRCTLEILKPNTYFTSVVFKFGMIAPPRLEGGSLAFRASATAREPNYNGSRAESTATTIVYRTFVVTSTGDRGSGSLRSAIEEANALCDAGPPCSVQFHITEPSATPWKTIRLETPLPVLRAYSLRIDGATQAAFSGVANPDGPSIEISGGGSAEDDGFTATCYVEIANLAINGFRRNGISLTSGGSCVCRSGPGCYYFYSRASIHDNFIGTDPTGSVARPNDRGIGVSDRIVLYQTAAIANNVISGNSKSGLFALGGDLEIMSNRIGLHAHSDAPLPNGASGLYFHQTTGRINITKNAIAFNREFGVAIHPRAPYVYLAENRIWRNGRQAVDDGLDGASPSVVTPDGGTLQTPVITSATYDPVKHKTTVRGIAGEFRGVLQVFASDTRGATSSGDAQRYLGYAVALILAFPNFEFAFEYDGDLRGQWITAMASRGFYHPAADIYSLSRSGELSAAVQVQ